MTKRTARPRSQKRKPAPPRSRETASPGTPIDADVDWQASVLAEKVLKRVMSLRDAVQELDEWQRETAKPDSAPSTSDAGEINTPAAAMAAQPDSRALIVTHMMNTLLKRGD